ncbi:aldolase/citrate lyase family protein [Saccharopolyspora elongata]|uniref:aldolase/citrate lyase family protein n=1 Tax=Saccharopolyspora elongata TaxID=2530387 RepID=UPI0038B58F20
MQRVLDLGADGLIVSHVDTRSRWWASPTTRRAVNAGLPSTAAPGDTELKAPLSTSPLQRKPRSSCRILEAPRACDNAAEIVAVPCVDAGFVGPADLSVAMGLTGGAAEPAVSGRSPEHGWRQPADRN